VITAAAAPGPARVVAIRSFIRRRRRRAWYDWYSTGFAVVLAVILLWDLLAQPFDRLTGPGGTGGVAGANPAQAVAGAALVIGAAAGLLVLAQALGPLALSPADATWLLLAPLDHRELLRRPAAVTAAIAVAAGGALGVLALAMAGPFLRLPAGAHRVPWAWLTAVTAAMVAACASWTARLTAPEAQSLSATFFARTIRSFLLMSNRSGRKNNMNEASTSYEPTGRGRGA
jgi:Family of unknown function (DUF6297)